MNLTEQWKKGKLPEWFYWIEFQDGKILPTTFSNQHGFICCDVICDEEKIKQILAEMPCYELWKAVHEQWKVLLEENTKLKELLKKVNEHFKKVDFEDNWYVDYELWADIKQALGEE